MTQYWCGGWIGVVVVSAVHVDGTRGLGIGYNAADMLWMSVVREMRGVGEVCEVCICLARGRVCGEGGEERRGFGLGFTNPVRVGGVLDVCLCLVCVWVV